MRNIKFKIKRLLHILKWILKRNCSVSLSIQHLFNDFDFLLHQSRQRVICNWMFPMRRTNSSTMSWSMNEHSRNIIHFCEKFPYFCLNMTQITTRRIFIVFYMFFQFFLFILILQFCSVHFLVLIEFGLINSLTLFK